MVLAQVQVAMLDCHCISFGRLISNLERNIHANLRGEPLSKRTWMQGLLKTVRLGRQDSKEGTDYFRSSQSSLGEGKMPESCPGVHRAELSC